MRNIGLMFGVCLFMVCNVQAKVKPLTKEKWQEYTQRAQKENKIIFLEFFEPDCEVCGEFDKYVRSDSRVKALTEKEFIVVRTSVDRAYGQTLAMKFRAGTVPSVALLSPALRMVGKIRSTTEPEVVLKAQNDALRNKAAGLFYPGVTETIELEFPDFYANSFVEGTDKFTKEAMEYLSQKKDLTDEISFAIACQFGVNRSLTPLLYKQMEKIVPKFGTEDAYALFESTLEEPFQKAVEAKSEDDFNKILQAVDVFLKDQEYVRKYRWETTLRFLQETKGWNGYLMHIQRGISANHEIPDHQLHTYCKVLLQNPPDEEFRQLPATWMSGVIERNPENGRYFKTYGALLIVAGNDALGEKALKRAEELLGK